MEQIECSQIICPDCGRLAVHETHHETQTMYTGEYETDPHGREWKATETVNLTPGYVIDC